MNKNTVLTFGFGAVAGIAIGASTIAAMNQQKTVENFSKVYRQLTFNNITSFCGTLWMTSLAYRYSVGLFRN